MEEIWKDIPQYEGKYQISSLGRVKSLQYHNGKGVKREGILRQARDSKGYSRCALSKDNILTTFKVHRLVANAFIPNPFNLPQVNHLNGNKSDNRVENLEWCDNSHNQIHAYSNGLNRSHKAHYTRCALTYIDSGEELAFSCIKEMASYLGVNRNTISQWLKGGNKRKTGHRNFTIRVL